METPVKGFNRTDHLANERTFLAWIRTNLGIMAFGFVIGKFTFFMEQAGAFLGRPVTSTEHYSSFFGICLIGVGVLLCFFAFLKFKRTENQINSETYKPSMILDTWLMLLVMLIGIFLIIYLALPHPVPIKVEGSL